MTQEPKSKEKKSQPNDFLRYTGMATKMGVVIALAVFGGIKLDESNGSEPLWTLILSLVGVAGAIYFVIKDTSPRR